ncbi:MAG: hypothetical protein J5644_11395, partial [Bacteroidales bacterium]|nr:hypothetical protein [Bacteroidales bacterium]
MKTINRIFFQIIALTMIMSVAVSNASAQQECIKAYMVHEESCNPGADGIAAITIPSALAGKCIVEWQLGSGISNDLVVSGLTEGTYPVTVRSTTCTTVVFYSGYVDITRDEACKVKVVVEGPTYVEGTCNELPSVQFTATAMGGVPPYTFHGWTQVNSTTATRTVSPSGGAFVVSCYVSDSTGHYGADELHGYAKKMECAKDPNEIKGPDGYSEEKHFVNNTNKMNYTIDFENDPDFAMAPASRVTITYDVPAQQNIRTFRLADFGFGNFVFTVPSNVSAYSQRLDVSDSLGVWVDVTAGINVANRQLFWTFQSIDPATGAEPASSQMGFLPINDSLSHGEGYVSFYIAPDANVQTGDTVGAEALIVFDDNAPIGTNVWTNTFDVVAPTSTLYAQMDAEDSLYCSFTFEVQDDPNGSGVQSVEVYMSANNADYVSIGSTVPDSTLSLALENGVYYQFMSIATDNVGNKEAFKAKADTSVNYNTAPIDLVLNGNTFYEYDPMNTRIGTLFTLDNDVNLPFVYELVAGEGDDDNHLFMIEDNVLKTDTTFVCSRQTEYSVRIKTTDIGGLSLEKSFALNEVQQHITPITRLSKAICAGSSIDFYGRELTEAGTYTDTLTTSEGCDSIVVWYLMVNPTSHVILDTTVCESFVWHDSTYTVSGTYTHDYLNEYDCASTDTLHLTVNYGTHNVLDTTVCENFVWNEQTYTTSGTYIHNYFNDNNCASADTLHLTVNYGTHNVLDTTVCESIVWNGQTYTESGTYAYDYENDKGCASADTLHLTVNYGTHNVLDTTVCESFVWNGGNYTQSGTYTYEYTNTNGCASADTL